MPRSREETTTDPATDTTTTYWGPVDNHPRIWFFLFLVILLFIIYCLWGDGCEKVKGSSMKSSMAPSLPSGGKTSYYFV